MLEMLLIKPSYPYGRPQVWMPVDLMKVASQIEMVGIRTDIADLNMENLPDIDRYDYVGIGVTGAPYIPVTKGISDSLVERGKKVIAGGPGVEHLKPKEFGRIYGESPVQIRVDDDLAKVLGTLNIPSVYNASISEQIDRLPKGKMWEYLSREFTFPVSQGCKYSCRFCAAVRNDPRSPEKVREVFSETIGEDIRTLSENARQVGIRKLKMYLSSLDLFQTPDKMLEVLEDMGKARESYGMDFDLRGLSRVDSFLDAVKKYPEFHEVIKYSGMNTVGFGIDGTTDYVWKSQRKGRMSLEEADSAFWLCKTMGITPEALMVMGFNTIGERKGDDEESLRKNVEYSLSRAERYGVVCRPHVAKEFYPGTDGWEDSYWECQKEKLLDNPELFRNLDFVAYASEITHPDPDFRHKVNEAYGEIINSLDGTCTTSPIMPYRENDRSWNFYAEQFNRRSAFDR